MAYVREQSFDGAIISPSPVFALYTDNRNYVYLSPGLAAVRHKVEQATDGDLLLWFHGVPGYSCGPAQLAALPGLELVAELSDGLIFRVNRAYDPAAALRAEYRASTPGNRSAGPPLTDSSVKIGFYMPKSRARWRTPGGSRFSGVRVAGTGGSDTLDAAGFR